MRYHLIVAVTFAMSAAVSAQEAPPAAPPAAAQPAAATPRGARPLVPLEIQVSISRYQGDKKISSVPYVLAVNANSSDAQLTMNVEVPVASSRIVSPAPGTGKAPEPFESYTYRGVGTNIVCGATTADDGRFEITLGIDDSSVVPSGEGQAGIRPGMASFRNFKSRNRLLLRDGQTRQYTAATDRISGESVRIDVTLKVVK